MHNGLYVCLYTCSTVPAHLNRELPKRKKLAVGQGSACVMRVLCNGTASEMPVLLRDVGIKAQGFLSRSLTVAFHREPPAGTQCILTEALQL